MPHPKEERRRRTPPLPVPGDPELYSAELWLMTVGAYRIEVTVEGSRGAGTASVPVTSVMLGVRDMPACDWERCFCCWGDCSSRVR